MADVCHIYLHTKGVDYLVVGNFYSKMIFVWCLPPSQSNTNKVVLLLKEIFSEHDIPKVLCSDNGPQYASASLPILYIPGHNTWNLKSALPKIQWICWGMHQVCQTHNPMSQVQQCQSTAGPTSTPSYTHWHQASIPSRATVPGLRTIPVRIHNNDPSSIQVHEQINTCSEATKSQVDKCSKTPVPLYAGQPVAMYDTFRKIWVPATVICVLPWNSYQVHTSNGSIYCCTQRHLCECSAKAVNTVPHGTTATLQAPTRHHFSAAQPASPPPAQCMQPTPAALATQMSQDPAVPPHQLFKGMPLCQLPVTSPATPMQPQRSSHAHMAPRCLIRKSRNYQPGLPMDLVIVMCHCLHPQPIVRVK